MNNKNVLLIYHLDTTVLDDPALFYEYYSQMTADRQQKIDALRFEKDKRLSLGAGILLHQSLRDAGFDPLTVRQELGAHGKPFFPGLPAFQFSLSHSGTKVLCAVCDRSVGCDVQVIGEYKEQLAQRFFHPDEIEVLTAQETEEGKRLLFYQLWTLKESFLKSTGRGLSLPLNSFSVLPCSGSYALQQSAEDAAFGLYPLPLYEDYACACCVNDDNGTSVIQLRDVTL